MASGGATTAPKANATGKLTGKISHVIRPTPKAVTTTSSTESCAMDRRFARRVDYRGPDGCGVQQRWQKATQHDLSPTAQGRG